MGDDRTNVTDPLIGSQLGPYRIESLIGIGGMGRVYKAVQPSIGSRVAIKVLSRECSDRKDLVERFFAEAKAINHVAHENIVNVLDLATLPDGRPYIVMEYLDGTALANVIDEAKAANTPLPIGTVTRLCSEVLDALDAAHAKGVIHRDLKPDNIFVTPTGRAKVLDFGIAKLQPELGGKNTHTGSLLGTPPYMSPEQAAGRAIDTRADLYAMGIILFECLTGQRPFVADALFDLLKKHIEEPPPSPRSIRPELPLELEQVILTSLAKFPAQRFANARAMSAALQHATQHLPPEQWAPLKIGSRQATSSFTPGGTPKAWSTPGGDLAMAATQNVTPVEARGGTLTHHPSSKPPTQTSGQTTAPPTLAPSRNLGPWIALSALIAVAGGIAAIVLVTNKSKAPEQVAQTPGPTQPEPPAPPVIDKVETPAPPAPPTVNKPAKADKDDPDPDDSDPEDLDDVIEQAIAASGADLPPEAKAALKKYGVWGKVPAAERKKLAMQLTGVLSKSTADILEQTGKQLQQQGADMKKQPDTSLVAVTALDVPANWTNADSTIALGLKTAKKYRADAKLTRIDLDGLYVDGHADKEINLRFVASGTPCGLWVDFEPETARVRPMPEWCTDAVAGHPHCTVKQVMQKYGALHPAQQGPVSAFYAMNPAKKVARWIVGSDTIADDCGAKN